MPTDRLFLGFSDGLKQDAWREKASARPFFIKGVEMPKVQDTRKQRATKLLKMIKQGPSMFGCGITYVTESEFAKDWKIWSESWIIPELVQLIPELKKKHGGDLCS